MNKEYKYIYLILKKLFIEIKMIFAEKFSLKWKDKLWKQWDYVDQRIENEIYKSC